MRSLGNLLKNVKITHLTADGTNYPLAAGITDVESGYVDMAGWDGVLFVVVMGDNADTGTLEVKVEQCDTSGGTYAALSGASYSLTAGASDTDHKMMAFDVYRPQERYLHLDINRGTANTVLQSVVAIQYRGQKNPITQAVTAGQFNAAAAVVALVEPAEA